MTHDPNREGFTEEELRTRRADGPLLGEPQWLHDGGRDAYMAHWEDGERTRTGVLLSLPEAIDIVLGVAANCQECGEYLADCIGRLCPDCKRRAMAHNNPKE